MTTRRLKITQNDHKVKKKKNGPKGQKDTT